MPGIGCTTNIQVKANSMKNIVFWTAVGTVSFGAVCNALGFLDTLPGFTIPAAKTSYESAASDVVGYRTKYTDAVTGSWVKSITGWSCYGIAAGLFIWCLLMPDMVPAQAIIPYFDGHNTALQIAIRF